VGWRKNLLWVFAQNLLSQSL